MRLPGPADGEGLTPLWAALVSAALATLATLYLHHAVGQQLAYPPTDSDWYRAMAAGQRAIKPFGNRVLGPFLAHGWGRAAGSSDNAGFYVLGLASIWVAIGGVLFPVLRHRQVLGLSPALLLMFYWRDLFRNYFLPDLLHAALLVVFFLFLRARAWAAAAAMLVPLYLARESTLLLSLIAVPILWRLLGRRTAALFLGASVAGAGISKYASRHALPNIHHLNDTLYMLAKVPWNFSRNVLGMGLWTNADVDQQAPARVWRVAPWLHLGGVHQVGVYPLNWIDPVVSLMTLLLVFGLGPCVAGCLLYRVPLRQLLPRSEPWLCLAAIYGGVAYLLAPSLGISLFRLVGYGWPLFLLYVPAMLPRVWRDWRWWQAGCLLAAHLLPCWFVVSGAVRQPLAQIAVVLLADGVGATLLLRKPLNAEATRDRARVYDEKPRTALTARIFCKGSGSDARNRTA